MQRTKKRQLLSTLLCAVMLSLTIIPVTASGVNSIDDFDLIETPFGISDKELRNVYGENRETTKFKVGDYDIIAYKYARPDGDRSTTYFYHNDNFIYAAEEYRFYSSSNEAYADIINNADEMTLWYDRPIAEGKWSKDGWNAERALAKLKRFPMQWGVDTGRSAMAAYWEEDERCVMMLLISRVNKKSGSQYVLERYFFDPDFFSEYGDSVKLLIKRDL